MSNQPTQGEATVNKMTTEHLKRCQAIAEKTGGKELAAAIAFAFALAKRETK